MSTAKSQAPQGSNATTHGMSQSREYRIWFDMRRRCNEPKNKNYPHYGGRGIFVCAKWNDSFLAFFKDMGPANGLTLERRHNDGPYGPRNCFWATRKQQSRNRSYNHLLEFQGETMCISAWAERAGISRDTFKRRIYLGWSIERAITEPVGRART